MNAVLKDSPKDSIIRYSKGNVESLLEESLSKKYGARWTDYRKTYRQSVSLDKNNPISFDFPLTVFLELVNRCNLNCVMCNQKFRNDAPKNTLSEAVIDKLFSEFKKHRLPSLMITISEPLLYKNISFVLEKCAEADIMDTFIITNGALLDDRKQDMLLDSSLTRLFISVDATTEMTYNKVRPAAHGHIRGGGVTSIEKNIRNFIEKRNSKNKILPVVRVSFVSMKINQHEQEDFIEKWKDIVDSVEIQQKFSIAAAFDAIGRSSPPALQMPISPKLHCWQPWSRLSVFSDGTVVPCCTIMGRYIPVGNVYKQSIYDIWNGSNIKMLRTELLSSNLNPACTACLAYRDVNFGSLP
jgi:radical SAM protein with 4Fe4S-binding SPASM domain